MGGFPGMYSNTAVLLLGGDLLSCGIAAVLFRGAWSSP